MLVNRVGLPFGFWINNMDFTLSFPVSTNVISSVFFTVCSFVLVCLHALLRPETLAFLA